MENLNLFLEMNNMYNNIKLHLKENKLVYTIKDEVFDGKTVKKIINFVNALIKAYGRIKIPIVFFLECKSVIATTFYCYE